MGEPLRSCARNELQDQLSKSIDFERLLEAGIGSAILCGSLVELHEGAPHQHDRKHAQLGVSLQIRANFVAVFLLQEDVGEDDVGLEYARDLDYVDASMHGFHFDGEILESQLHDFFDRGALVGEQDAQCHGSS